MSYANKTFDEISREVVEDFLQSVVVVDDQAFLHVREKPSALTTPGRARRPGKIAEIHAAASEGPTGEEVQANGFRHDLDAKVLIDAFAQAGLVCAVLRPQHGDGGQRRLEQRTDRATQRADIVILDWRIRTDEVPGTTALKLLHTILASDQPDRLRLIAIYTGEPDLNEIGQKVQESLGADANVDPSGLVITKGAVRVSIFAKSGGIASRPETAGRVLAEADLPARLIAEFSETTKGLLANVALRSLGALRANTHRIIRKFDRELDAPYLAHRALMVPPDEAEQHPIPLISSELQDVLEDREVCQLVGPTVIESWVRSQINGGLSLNGKVGEMSGEQVQTALTDLISNGLDGEESSANYAHWAEFLKELKDPATRAGLSKITDLLTRDGISARDKDMEFALLMGVRTQYDVPSPQLTLGTIVAEDIEAGTRYLLCVQPPCDSVRLKEKRAFPFLKLVDAAQSAADDFDLVVRDKTKLLGLRLSLRPCDSRLITLKPKTGHKEVRATKDPKQNWIFETTGDVPNLRWIADLKPAHAQRIANLYGANIARVGLTESEWLRRMGKSRGAV